jgi:Flp pilus assembly protein TadB
MRKIGGVLLAVGMGILIGWGLYLIFGLVFPWLPLPVKIALAAIAIGLILLLASLVWERRKASQQEDDKFKEVEK